MSTTQEKVWGGRFGKEYTDRCFRDIQQSNEITLKNYGVTKTQMNETFLAELPRDISILEVGVNIGVQLAHLKKLGFSKLHGIDFQNYPLKKSLLRNENVLIAQASAFALPFKDDSFDLVMTSDFLIHISPKDHETVFSEIHRVSKKYIWGFEYFSPTFEEVCYRTNGDLLWTGDYSKAFRDQFPQLTLEKEVEYPYVSESGKKDRMYLLKKKNHA